MRRDTREIRDRNNFIILLSYLYKLRISITRYNYTFNAIHINLIMDTLELKFNLPGSFLNKYKIINFVFVFLFLKKKSFLEKLTRKALSIVCCPILSVRFALFKS